MKQWSFLNNLGAILLIGALTVSPSNAQEQQDSRQENSDRSPVIDREVFNSQLQLEPVEIEAAPYQRVSDIILSQVGVNRRHNTSDEILFRGTGAEGTDFIVDGISQRESLLNIPDYSVNLDAIEDIEIITSGFTAEYGNVRSGVINVRTKGDDAPPTLLNVGNDELTRVARAFVSILQLREDLQMRTLSPEEFEEKATRVIESEGVSPQRYAEVVNAAQNNSKLEKRLLERAREVAE